jgi:hypothetical protein
MTANQTISELSDAELRELVADIFAVEEEHRTKAELEREEQTVMQFLERRERDRTPLAVHKPQLRR